MLRAREDSSSQPPVEATPAIPTETPRTVYSGFPSSRVGMYLPDSKTASALPSGRMSSCEEDSNSESIGVDGSEARAVFSSQAPSARQPTSPPFLPSVRLEHGIANCGLAEVIPKESPRVPHSAAAKAVEGKHGDAEVVAKVPEVCAHEEIGRSERKRNTPWKFD